jgi:Zn finger protein HypA/HybF involved in hydrogenase expression
MHELSLAQGLLTQLTEMAAAHEATKIITVRVSIGYNSGIVVDSFSFGFNAIKADDELTGDTVLEISRTEGTDLMLMQVEME